MGERAVRSGEADELRAFTKALLADLQALEKMVEEGLIESDVQRIGAEQEVFLVGRDWRPAFLAPELLAELDDPRYTTELARFNLEFNLDPIRLGPDCLRRMEEQIEALLGRLEEAAARRGGHAVLLGILPTVEKSHLGLESMTPEPRYHSLNEALTRLRGEHYTIQIKGRDELILRHDNVMVEACNTSFQVHFQVQPRDFAARYNAAQAVAGPVLAAATNSPLLFGKRLWRETRIALFQQSIDTRAPSTVLRDQSPRVSFGRRWVRESALEIFEEDIARFRVLLSIDVDEDPFAALREGRPPQLAALRLHNSTVYRWNRPCYGISDGRPHLRIENRILPSGPTAVDEVANAAFWFGLMRGVVEEYGDITRAMDFAIAKENFLAAAQVGLAAQLGWPGRQSVPAGELILGELLPLARQGLAELGIAGGDADRYLGVVEERVRSRRTGSQWLLDSLDALEDRGTASERLAALVAAAHTRQRAGRPVHAWEPARLAEAGGWGSHYTRVEQIMTTELFTVEQDELVDLAAHVMRWSHSRHVPVEDEGHRLVGLVTLRSLLKVFEDRLAEKEAGAVPVSRIMETDLVTVSPETPTLEAVALMKHHRIGCLPVVTSDRRLVGMVTERHFLAIAGQLLADRLEE